MAAQSCTIRIFAVKCRMSHFNALFLSNLWEYRQKSYKDLLPKALCGQKSVKTDHWPGLQSHYRMPVFLWFTVYNKKMGCRRENARCIKAKHKTPQVHIGILHLGLLSNFSCFKQEWWLSEWRWITNRLVRSCHLASAFVLFIEDTSVRLQKFLLEKIQLMISSVLTWRK